MVCWKFRRGQARLTLLKINRARVELQEMRSGVTSPKKTVGFTQALEDPDTRAEYIRRESPEPPYVHLSQPFLS